MDYFRRTRILPNIHTVTLRNGLYEQHLWAAQSSFKAFAKAKARAKEEMRDTDALLVRLLWLIDHIE